MSFEFEHIVKYKMANERIRANRYNNQYYNSEGHTRDGDILICFTVEKYALEEDQRNRARLLDSARSIGARYLIHGQRGPQIVIPGIVSGADKIFTDYQEQFKQAWETESNYMTYLDVRNYNSDRATAVSCRGYRRAYGHVMPGFTGVYDVATGNKLKGRQNILRALWDMGFLGDRGVVLYAANYRDGSPEDVRRYLQIKSLTKTLSRNSPIVKGLQSGMNKIYRACDWPQQ